MNTPNALEQKLMLAADHPESRPAFYTALLASNIFVLGFSGNRSGGDTALQPGEKVSIARWGKSDGTTVVPFFTSLQALQSTVKEESQYLAMPARGFFELTLGDMVVLNPSLPYGKEFTASEIRALLDTGMNQAVHSRILEKPTEVLLGQPSADLSEMKAALKKLLTNHPVVRAVYLCSIHETASAEKPSLFIGFDGNGDMSKAMKEAGSVAVDTAPKGETVDFVVLNRRDGGIHHYMFNSVKPFYKRSLAVTLRLAFGAKTA